MFTPCLYSLFRTLFLIWAFISICGHVYIESNSLLRLLHCSTTTQCRALAPDAQINTITATSLVGGDGGLCACLLAGAVSGMHWTAAVGTVYRDHDRRVMIGSQLSRSQVVIICAVFVCSKVSLILGVECTDNYLGLSCMSDLVGVCYFGWAQSQEVDNPGTPSLFLLVLTLITLGESWLRLRLCFLRGRLSIIISDGYVS
jgi:hypothetical protein